MKKVLLLVAAFIILGLAGCSGGGSCSGCSSPKGISPLSVVLSPNFLKVDESGTVTVTLKSATVQPNTVVTVSAILKGIKFESFSFLESDSCVLSVETKSCSIPVTGTTAGTAAVVALLEGYSPIASNTITVTQTFAYVSDGNSRIYYFSVDPKSGALSPIKISGSQYQAYANTFVNTVTNTNLIVANGTLFVLDSFGNHIEYCALSVSGNVSCRESAPVVSQYCQSNCAMTMAYDGGNSIYVGNESQNINLFQFSTASIANLSYTGESWLATFVGTNFNNALAINSATGTIYAAYESLSYGYLSVLGVPDFNNSTANTNQINNILTNNGYIYVGNSISESSGILTYYPIESSTGNIIGNGTQIAQPPVETWNPSNGIAFNNGYAYITDIAESVIWTYVVESSGNLVYSGESAVSIIGGATPRWITIYNTAGQLNVQLSNPNPTSGESIVATVSILGGNGVAVLPVNFSINNGSWTLSSESCTITSSTLPRNSCSIGVVAGSESATLTVTNQYYAPVYTRAAAQ